MELRKKIIFFSLLIYSIGAFAQNTFVKTLFYNGGGYNSYHHDSLSVGPLEYAPISGGNFFVLNMNYEQAQESIYKIDENGNILNSITVAYWGGIHETDAYGLNITPSKGCTYIQHSYSFSTGDESYILHEIDSNGVDTIISTWNFPNILYRAIANNHNSYYCSLDTGVLDLATGVVTANQMGIYLFSNDDFLYSSQTISRKDLAGNVAWSIPGNGYNVVAASEISIYALGDSLIRINPLTGNILWKIPFAFPVTGFGVNENGGLNALGSVVIEIDSSGNLLSQSNLATPTAFPPSTRLGYFVCLKDGSWVSGGSFLSKTHDYSDWYRSSFIYKLNQQGRGTVDSIQFYYKGDADYDFHYSFADDAVFVAAAMGHSNGMADINQQNYYGYPWIYSPKWNHGFKSGLNYQFSDLDLDGTIDSNDVDYLFAFQPAPNGSLHVDTNGTPFFLKVENQSLLPGDTVRMYIIAGTPSDPVDSLYGLSFEIRNFGGLLLSEFRVFTHSVLGDTMTNLFFVSNHKFPGHSIPMAVSSRRDSQNISLAGDTLFTIEGIVSPQADPWAYRMILFLHAITEGGFDVPLYPVTDTVFVQSTTGIEIVSPSKDYRIYPNPAQHSVTISALETINSIEIYNPGNQLLKKYTPELSEINLDVSDFKPGIYFLKLIMRSEQTAVKLIITSRE